MKPNWAWAREAFIWEKRHKGSAACTLSVNEASLSLRIRATLWFDFSEIESSFQISKFKCLEDRSSKDWSRNIFSFRSPSCYFPWTPTHLFLSLFSLSSTATNPPSPLGNVGLPILRRRLPPNRRRCLLEIPSIMCLDFSLLCFGSIWKQQPSSQDSIRLWYLGFRNHAIDCWCCLSHL